MVELRVGVSKDGLSALLQIPQNLVKLPTIAEIRALLEKNGVFYGINQDILKLISEGKIKNSTVEVARGIAPVEGCNGRIELLVDISEKGKPKILESGRADYHEINLLINVSKNQVIARHVPPSQGEVGFSVSGKKIHQKVVSDVPLPIGIGTCISETDPNLLVAQIDGALCINSRGKIEIKNSQIIKGDIDYSTGDVCFHGDLQVEGTVKSGFSVKVVGSLKVKGNVENSKIQCKGDLEIAGGVTGGGEGVIECCGSLRSSHIENFTIHVNGDVNVDGDLINCIVISGGKVKANKIVGGSVSAFFIEAGIVGSSAETKTILDIGKNFQIDRERYGLLKKLSEISSEQVLLRTKVFELLRDNMNDCGILSEENEKKLEILKSKTIELHNNSDSVQKRIEEIEEIENKNSESAIIVKELFPNTLVKLGANDKLIMEKSVNVMLKPGMTNVV